MALHRVLTFAQALMKEHIQKGDTVIDGTCGNGSDTAFLASLVGSEGKVYGFDIQEQAIENTEKKLLEKNLLDRVACIQDGHENIAKWIKEPVNAAMFNLGYLPGSDKKITTQANTTIKAITDLLSLLSPGGIVTIIVYTGHDQGSEGMRIEEYVQSLSQKELSVLKYQFINQKHHPPYLIAIEKNK